MNGAATGKPGRLAFENALTPSAREANAAARQKAVREFVALLYHEVLKAMRAASEQQGFVESESLPRDFYTAMMDAEIARVAARRDATGLSRAVERALGPARAVRTEPPQAPLSGTVSSPFGWRADPLDGKTRLHHGVDIAAPAGTPVRAAAGGKVTFSGRLAGYGNVVEVDHGGGLVTRYGHNAENLVVAGDRVRAGEAIALVGSSGRATGPHLHFEVRRNGAPVDPRDLLDGGVKGSRLDSLI
ncbi:MAG TPA: peptidoglycan DD-metalloendopeptidase family protein [candidate division Zixibacteria bacterium]|nr:peptidoglycan DD-metalloendopeptidase family protein [candidate division Zixibacteria bacterium]